MKVTKWIETSQEVEIEISAADVVAALSEAGEGWSRRQMVGLAVDNLAAVFRKLPDEAIAEFSDGPRKKVAAFLREQAARFDPEVRG